MKRHQLLFSCFLIILFSKVTAQTALNGRIYGRITDERNIPFGYANISLLKASDSTLVKGTAAANDGSFSLNIPDGNYIIAVNMMGFDKLVKGPYLVNAGKQFYNLGDLKLAPSARQLSGVNITYRKPLVERQVDKTVLNIENSVLAIGNTAFDILQKAPGVSISQAGVISLKGKQGSTVMIDGKPTYLSSEDLTNLLNATEGSAIQSIELITNPSAKYDASGAAGIINIILKKNRNFGTNGSVNLGGGYGTYAKENGDASINHRDGKINAYGNISYDHNKRFFDDDITRLNNTAADQTYFNQTGRTISERNNTSYKAGIDYFINEKNTLGIAVNGNVSRSNGKGNILTLIGNQPGETDSLVKAINTNNAKNTNITYNINYKGVLDTLGQQINIDADYSRYNRDRLDSYDNNYFNAAGAADKLPYIFRNFTPANIRIWALKADYVYPLSKGTKLNAGLKSSFVNTDNNSLFENYSEADWQYDGVRSNHFIYDENINAAYASIQKEFEHTTIQVGLRAEQTNSTGNSLTTQTVTKLHYLNLFPSVFVNHILSADHEIGFSYSRRIERPDYGSLNPFTRFIDLYTYSVGNPYLKPQFTNSFEVSYAYKKMINATLGYSYAKDVITQIITSDTLKKTLYNTEGNLAKYSSIDFNLSAPVQITKWWSSYNSLTAFYGKFSTPDLLGAPYDKGKAVLEFNTTQTITIAPTISAELSGSYRSKGLEATFSIASQYRADAGINKSFLSKKLNIKAALNDIFNSWKLTTSSTLPSQSYVHYIKPESQIFRLTCSYRFGNTNVKAARQRTKSSEDEQNRVKS